MTLFLPTQRVIEEHHDGDMVHVVVAPCSPFSVSTELMVESAELARKYGLQMHTHLCETIDEQDHCLERFGKRPVMQLVDWGWAGDDVWLAHGIHLTNDEISFLEMLEQESPTALHLMLALLLDCVLL